MKHFLKLTDLTTEEIRAVIQRAIAGKKELKEQGSNKDQPLGGKTGH